MDLEMLQRTKKERMRLSVKRTRSAKMGNSVNDLIGVLMLQHLPGCCPDGRTHSQGPKKQGCFECPEVNITKSFDFQHLLCRKFSCATNARKLCMVAVLIYKMLQQVNSRFTKTAPESRFVYCVLYSMIFTKVFCSCVGIVSCKCLHC